MNDFELLLCTDMDRTIIPNGTQSEHKKARKRFAEFCTLPNVTLVYVTGRHLQLVKEAIKLYTLPTPDYIISDVGTKIYHNMENTWKEITRWDEEIAKSWGGKSQNDLKNILKNFNALKLQERSKQNTHKLSYYVSLHVYKDQLLAQIDQYLKEHSINASLVWSIDEPKGIGLLDILPKDATKLHAIEFLYAELGYSIEHVVFAGDSGNDLPVMASSINSILVANTASDIRESAKKMAQQNDHAQTLFLANGQHSDMNGNYSAGVLEGIGHFIPQLRRQLTEYGFDYEQLS